MKFYRAFARKETWVGIAVLSIALTVLAYWSNIRASINNYSIVVAYVTIILAIYAGVSQWWSHKRALLEDKQKAVDDLHASLEEFYQIFRYFADHIPNDLIQFQRLSSSADSALTRFSNAYARSRHVIPGYLSPLSQTMIEQLSTLATSNEHDVEKLKEKLKEEKEPFLKTLNALFLLSTKYEERFKIRFEYYEWIFRNKGFDKNLVKCPKCQKYGSPVDKFCSKCGIDLTQVEKRTKWWVCATCSARDKLGQENLRPYDAHYCTICGNLLPRDCEHTRYTGVDGWPLKLDPIRWALETYLASSTYRALAIHDDPGGCTLEAYGIEFQDNKWHEVNDAIKELGGSWILATKSTEAHWRIPKIQP